MNEPIPPDLDQPPTRNRLPTVRFPRPRCPRCEGTALAKYRSIVEQGDGSSMAWVRCRNPECAHRFKIVLE